MTFDITDTLTPKSTQVNADDFTTGPATVTAAEVRRGNAEQPVQVHLVEYPGRPFMPSKTVRRILAAAWGKDASQWAGRRMTLYTDPTVRFGGKEVGGIRVSHLSHIDKRQTYVLTATRGQKKAHTVEPLPADAPTTEPHPDWRALIEQAEGDVDTLRNIYTHAQQLGASEGVLNAIKTAAANATNTKEN